MPGELTAAQAIRILKQTLQDDPYLRCSRSFLIDTLARVPDGDAQKARLAATVDRLKQTIGKALPE